MPAAQTAFDRITRALIALEIDHATAVARSESVDPATVRLAKAKDSAWHELTALPNPLIAEIVFAERLDIALARRQRELAVEQRLLLVRVSPKEPEAREMARVVAAIATRRGTLHARQDSLHARYRAESSLEAGEWIRISYPTDEGAEPRRFMGRVLELGGDSLLLARTGGTPTTIRLSQDATIERAVSRRGHAWEGALLGMVSAGVLGTRKRGPFDDERGLRVLLYAPVGALIGGLIGSQVYSETWAPVIWHRPSDISAPAAVGFGARWTPGAGGRR